MGYSGTTWARSRSTHPASKNLSFNWPEAVGIMRSGHFICTFVTTSGYHRIQRDQNTSSWLDPDSITLNSLHHWLSKGALHSHTPREYG